MFVWTVNNAAEKREFEQRGIPFFTDSAVRDVPEAWTPPSVPSYSRQLIALLLLAFLILWFVTM